MGKITQARIWTLLCLWLLAGCADPGRAEVPADFLLVVDAESAADPAQHVHVRIDGAGHGRYQQYDTGGAIRGDLDGRVVYDQDQVVETGTFTVDPGALEQLWRAIREHHFFLLTGDYRAAQGFSYAYIRVEAQDRRHQVFNIGMEVPAIEAIVAATEAVLPAGVELQYREGFTP
jgi:hypothetical protein